MKTFNSIEMTPKEALDFLVKNLPLEAQQTTSIYHTAIRVLLQALTELEELKSWRDELNETIQDLISKAKYWEEKENKTDFEKGIARGYKTMLHQLLVGIDFDKEERK